MQINRIQSCSYKPQFQGCIKIQNLKKGEEVREFETSLELDKGLAELALNKLFRGNWSDKTERYIKNGELAQYIGTIQQTLGINIPKIQTKMTHIKLNHFDNGYSIRTDNGYKITHIRQDYMVW